MCWKWQGYTIALGFLGFAQVCRILARRASSALFSTVCTVVHAQASAGLHCSTLALETLISATTPNAHCLGRVFQLGRHRVLPVTRRKAPVRRVASASQAKRNTVRAEAKSAKNNSSVPGRRHLAVLSRPQSSSVVLVDPAQNVPLGRKRVGIEWPNIPWKTESSKAAPYVAFTIAERCAARQG